MPAGLPAVSIATAALHLICRPAARRRQCIPFPGEVDFLCGGPPCQGLSGNNRHAKDADILNERAVSRKKGEVASATEGVY